MATTTMYTCATDHTRDDARGRDDENQSSTQASSCGLPLTYPSVLVAGEVEVDLGVARRLAVLGAALVGTQGLALLWVIERTKVCSSERAAPMNTGFP